MRKRLSQSASGAGFRVVRDQACHGRTVLDQHERHVLVTHAVHALGKITRRLRDGDDRLFHKIRLSDYTEWSISGKSARRDIRFLRPRGQTALQFRWKSSSRTRRIATGRPSFVAGWNVQSRTLANACWSRSLSRLRVTLGSRTFPSEVTTRDSSTTP